VDLSDKNYDALAELGVVERTAKIEKEEVIEEQPVEKVLSKKELKRAKAIEAFEEANKNKNIVA